MSVQTRTTAIQNEIVRLYTNFTVDGHYRDPGSQPLVEILDTDGVTVLETISAQTEKLGIWYADYFVPADLPLGQYYDRWTFQWSPTSSAQEIVQEISVYSIDSYVNFVSKNTVSNISNKAVELMTALSNDFIYEAQHIPMHAEQGYRVQQDNQDKRRKSYYDFVIDGFLDDDGELYCVEEGAVYFNNGQKFTVFQSMTQYQSSSSSSSSSSDSVGNLSESSSSSSSSSIDSPSSSSSSELYSSSSSSSADSSSSSSQDSSSSSSGDITTTTTTWSYKLTLTCVGTGAPTPSGSLMLVSGTGNSKVDYTSFDERDSYFSTIYSLAYKNWLSDPRPTIRLNTRIVDDGWYADYNGRIYFDSLLAPEDSILADYFFAYFSENEILSFLNLGLDMMNATPPASWTYSSLSNAPRTWNAGILLYAAITALRRLLLGLTFQERAIIFGQDPAMIDRAMGIFQDLYKQYTETWNEVSVNLKKILPEISTYVMPEYTLPGGRSRWFRYLYKSGA